MCFSMKALSGSSQPNSMSFFEAMLRDVCAGNAFAVNTRMRIAHPTIFS